MMKKVNFNTNLSFKEAFRLLNELASHKADSDGDGEVMYYIQCPLNNKTRDILYFLGVVLELFDDEFYEPNNWIDLMPIWNEIQKHYGHNLHFNGQEFRVLDQDKLDLFEAANNVTEHLGIFAKQNDIGVFPELENLHEILQKIERKENQ